MHKIQTVFIEAKKIQDKLEIFKTTEDDHTSIADREQNHLIKMEENLAFKALKLLKKTYKIPRNAGIMIHKKIPLSSGLGGASSNAAAVLKGLNELWELNLTDHDLIDLGAKLGSDVPFFILGGTALATGYGEKLEWLPEIKGLDFKIHARTAHVANKTTARYQKLDLSRCGKDLEKTQKLVEAIRRGDYIEISKNLHNDFETIPEIAEKLQPLEHLSGSGPSTFEVILQKNL